MDRVRHIGRLLPRLYTRDRLNESIVCAITASFADPLNGSYAPLGRLLPRLDTRDNTISYPLLRAINVHLWQYIGGADVVF